MGYEGQALISSIWRPAIRPEGTAWNCDGEVQAGYLGKVLYQDSGWALEQALQGSGQAY